MKSIQLISIPVTDQLRAKEFYLKLGFEIMVEAPFEGDKQWIQLGFPGSDVSISLVTWFAGMPAGCIDGLVIKTDDIEGDVAMLASKGVAVGSVNKTPWGLFATVPDPDGNQLSLHQE
jgi:predicted enzyme related to lactoylglutathione lyase